MRGAGNGAVWSYEDVGAFFFVRVFVDAVVRLAVRAHVLRSSELAAFRLPLQSLIFYWVSLCKQSVVSFGVLNHTTAAVFRHAACNLALFLAARF